MYPKKHRKDILIEVLVEPTETKQANKLDELLEKHFLKGFEEGANAANEVLCSKYNLNSNQDNND